VAKPYTTNFIMKFMRNKLWPNSCIYQETE